MSSRCVWVVCDVGDEDVVDVEVRKCFASQQTNFEPEKGDLILKDNKVIH